MDPYIQGAYDALLWVHVNARKAGEEKTIQSVRDIVVCLAEKKADRFESMIIREVQNHMMQGQQNDLHELIEIPDELYEALYVQVRPLKILVPDYVSDLVLRVPRDISSQTH